MGTLRFTHPTFTCQYFSRMGKGAQRRTHQKTIPHKKGLQLQAFSIHGQQRSERDIVVKLTGCRRLRRSLRL